MITASTETKLRDLIKLLDIMITDGRHLHFAEKHNSRWGITGGKPTVPVSTCPDCEAKTEEYSGVIEHTQECKIAKMEAWVEELVAELSGSG